MRDQIISDFYEVEVAKLPNEQFSFDYDWADANRRKDALAKAWSELSEAGRQVFGGKIAKYFLANSLPDLTDAASGAVKNVHLFKAEIDKRVEAQDVFHLLPIDELYHFTSLMELLDNIENVEHIKELYLKRKLNSRRSESKAAGEPKKSADGGLATAEASKLRNCLRQGKELFVAGKNGSLMVKPLNFFYALTAYSYAGIILNNPVRYSLEVLPGSHGLNYLPKDYHVQFGGAVSKGTFTELFAAFPTNYIRSSNSNIEFSIDCFESICAMLDRKVTISIGTLLSMVPEIRDYYKLVTGNDSRTHPLNVEIFTDRFNAKVRFQIGDGVNMPSLAQVEQSFPGAAVHERHGKREVEILASDVRRIKAAIYSDVRGNFWFVENPIFPIVLPEPCLHFLLANVFSNVMRYSPDNWGNILLNDVDTDVSLIIRKYLSTLEGKMPIMVLRMISKYYPYIS